MNTMTGRLTRGITAAMLTLSLACLAEPARAQRAVAWGANWDSQLGDGVVSNVSNTAVEVSFMASGVTSIGGGEEQGLAVKDGSVWGWGANFWGTVGDGTTDDSSTPVRVDEANLTDIVAVAAANSSSYAPSSDGSLWVWGWNVAGQLGLGTTGGNYLTPQQLLPPSGYVFTSIAAGSHHVVAILEAIPPRVANVDTVETTGDGFPSEGELTDAAIT